MTLPLAYRPESRDDVDAAYGWYEGQKSGLGDNFLNALRETLDRMQAFPEAYAELHRGMRAIPIRQFPYVVYYRIEPDRLLIVAVKHGHQDPSGWQSRANQN